MRRFLALVLTGATAPGCATGATSSVRGRSVTVVPTRGGVSKAVAGELIAVEPDRLWVLGMERVVALPLASVAEVSLERHFVSSVFFVAIRIGRALRR